MDKPILIILAGGVGSRYGGLKQLDGVGPNAETIIEYSIYDAIRAGFGRVVIIVRESTLADFKAEMGGRLGDQVAIDYVIQPIPSDLDDQSTRTKPWGTGHALLVTEPVIDAPFAVLNADDYYGKSAFQSMAEFLKHRVTPNRFSMVGFELKKTLSEHGSVSRGVCGVDENGCLTSVAEHKEIIAVGEGFEDRSFEPPIAIAADSLVSMNFWGFHPCVFKPLQLSFNEFLAQHGAEPKSEFYIPLFVDELIQSGKAEVEVLQSREQWYGLTYAEDKGTLETALGKLTASGLYKSPLWG